jgi:hypothetical protein
MWLKLRVVKSPSNEQVMLPCSSLKSDTSTFSLSIEAESRIPEDAERSQDPLNGTPVSLAPEQIDLLLDFLPHIGH